MKRDTINYTLVGGVVITALLLLAFVMLRITGGSGSTDSYYIYLSNVSGIKFGIPVYYQGYRVGQVESIEPERVENRTHFRITLSVMKDWPIYQDSIARAEMGGLLADMFVGISEGSSSILLKPNSEVISEERIDMFASINGLADELTLLTQEQLVPLGDLANKRLNEITVDFADKAPEIMGNIDQLMLNLNRSSQTLNAMLSDSNKSNVSEILNNINGASQNIHQLTTDFAHTAAMLDTLLNQTDLLVGENRPAIKASLLELERTFSTISDRIESITYNIDSASRNANEFTQEIRRRPNRILFSPNADEVEE